MSDERDRERRQRARRAATAARLRKSRPEAQDAGTTEATPVARPTASALASKYPGLFKPAPGRPGRVEVTMPAPKPKPPRDAAAPD